MSFSIVSALALLMTLGEIFLNNGNFKTHYADHEAPQAIELMRKSCRMILENEDIKQLSPDALISLVKQGIERQETKIKEQVKNYCDKQDFEFRKLNDPGMEPPACDKNEALAAIQENLPKLVSPISEPLQIFKDFDVKDAVELYDFICSPTPTATPPTKVSIKEVLEFYNKAVAEALSVDLNQFNQPILPQSSLIYSADGRKVIGEIYSKEGRRTWVPFSQIPDVVKHAFISAEDKNFFKHTGVELRGVLRGFIRYMKDKTIVGGSTLTQQVVKNLVLSNDITLERKVKEMMIATRLEKFLTKEKILEIYLNLINLGRNSWGIQTATENYFGEERFVSSLGLNEASFLAGVTHSPNRYEPEFNKDKIKERQQFVLKEMMENGYITEEQMNAVNTDDLKFIDRKILQSSYFHKAVEEDIQKRLDPVDAQQGGLYLFSTQIPSVQKAMEKALQERLFQFELSKGRLKWNGPLGNMLDKEAKEMDVFELGEFHDPRFWTEKLKRFKALYHDVHWSLAVILDINREQTLVGVMDDEGKPVITNLYRNYKTRWGSEAIRSLKVGDVIFVELTDKVANLRIPPQVQGAAVAMEAKTGKVIALTGGFSFHDSELNRAINSFRQPGSTVKPFTYLAALNQGIQPDEILPNNYIRFAPIYIPGARKIRRNMKCNAWSVRNYSSGGASSMTLRRGLETSNNRVTAHLLKRIWPSDPELSLNMVRDIMIDFGIYADPQDCYPLILGSDETNVVKLAAAYAAIANGGTWVEPHFLDTKKNAGLLQVAPRQKQIFSVDKVSMFQLRSILAGAVTRGTGYALRDFSGYVAGKTGTSSSFNDAWFMGFSNDVVVGVWIGYDNGSRTDGKTDLGDGGTGGSLAAPVAKEVFAEAFKYYPPTPLLDNPPAGVSLYEMDGVTEAFRGGYAPRTTYDDWNTRDRRYNNDYNDDFYTDPDPWEDSGFYFNDDPIYEDPEERTTPISPRAGRAIETGAGGLF